ncbi:acyl carrier protein [Streptomyces sp. SKN60]|uniref:acyl carrier protein n=1 Tax=Streptomyces sp. SKN60 TaxID=2855506 RepID=UPI0022480C31|nr:phosphopantetheine-binding protein [Streptomyces sp. SKN60]MCX2181997.1 acyl carrier protein [Streptomyces sp. SKN60]
MTSLYEPIKSVVARHFNIPEDTITPESTLEDLGMDSLAVVELMCILQDDMGLRVPEPEHLKSLQATFREAVAAVERAQQPAAALPAATGAPVRPA